jgi:RNA polymerase sigma-70 factor (ECF subfamily)
MAAALDDGLDALRTGDEEAFVALVRAHHPMLLRVAMAHVHDRAVAEEVAQETWLGALTGVDRFEGRSSLRTWLVRIAVNIARRRAEREKRCLPFSAIAPRGPDPRPVDEMRFLASDHAVWPGRWARGPAAWQTPEERLLARETRDVLAAAIAGLPPAQRTVVTLRDVEGWPADEVCAALGLTAANQRVLLHRARSRVRDALAAHLAPAERAA